MPGKLGSGADQLAAAQTSEQVCQGVPGPTGLGTMPLASHRPLPGATALPWEIAPRHGAQRTTAFADGSLMLLTPRKITKETFHFDKLI